MNKIKLSENYLSETPFVPGGYVTIPLEMEEHWDNKCSELWIDTQYANLVHLGYCAIALLTNKGKLIKTGNAFIEALEYDAINTSDAPNAVHIVLVWS